MKFTKDAIQYKLTAVWRPILMLSFVAIIVNNYILAPYLAAMFDWSVELTLNQNMWDLLKLGVGGYIGGRSVEKVADSVGKGFGKNKE